MTNNVHIPTNDEDLIDSRDVLEAIAWFGDDADDDEVETLAALKALAEECEGYGDWDYGETLIRDSYFQEYAQELAEDIGAVDSCAAWPNDCIDWEQAASELQQDYMSVDFDGVVYWMRSA